jgi:hypothetical protein
MIRGFNPLRATRGGWRFTPAARRAPHRGLRLRNHLLTPIAGPRTCRDESDQATVQQARMVHRVQGLLHPPRVEGRPIRGAGGDRVTARSVRRGSDRARRAWIGTTRLKSPRPPIGIMGRGICIRGAIRDTGAIQGIRRFRVQARRSFRTIFTAGARSCSTGIAPRSVCRRPDRADRRTPRRSRRGLRAGRRIFGTGLGRRRIRIRARRQNRI